VLPLAVLGAGAVAVGLVAWGWSRSRAVGEPEEAVDPELERRLDDELSRFEP
jgi:hypothetical protein